MQRAAITSLLLAIIIPNSFGAQQCINGKFCYEGDFYVASKSAADRPKCQTSSCAFQHFSPFSKNGAILKTIQAKRASRYVHAIRLTYTDDSRYDIGSYSSAPGTEQTLNINVGNQEYITGTKFQGDDGRLCQFTFYLRDPVTLASRTVNVGATGCGGDGGGDNNVASGIFAGIYGYADRGAYRVDMVGVYFLRKIKSVTQESTNISGFKTPPILKTLDNYPIDASISTTTANYDVEMKEGFTSSTQTSFSSSSFYGVAVQAKYKYTGVSSSGSISTKVDLQHTVSKEAIKTEEVTGEKTVKKSVALCCPKGYFCNWIWYQGQGAVTLQDGASASVLTVYEFESLKKMNIYSSATYTGTANDKLYYVTVETTPQFTQPIKDAENPCESLATGKRRLHQSGKLLKPQNFTLTTGAYIEKRFDFLSDAQFKKVRSNVNKKASTLGFPKGSTVFVNSLMKEFKQCAGIKKGEVVKARYSGFGVLQAKKIKP